MRGCRDDAIGSITVPRCWSGWVASATVVSTCLLVLTYSARQMSEGAPATSPTNVYETASAQSNPIPRVRFTDITDLAGIDFVHENGARGQKLLPETMGGGCAFFDYDSDGDQDLLFVNSQPLPEA